MTRSLSPKLQLSIGLLSLTVSLVFIAASLGLWPDVQRAELEARATVSGALAIQLAIMASRNDVEAIKDTIDTVARRGPDLRSVAIRDAGGYLIAASPDHAILWRDPPNGKSTPTHVQLPLRDGETPAGRIEIVFRSLDAGRWLGLSSTLLIFVGFIGGAGFIGYYLLLGRALRELDPGRVIPERVKAAFDTLAEGVLIIDDEERVLMANRAFSRKILGSDQPQIGSDASDLPWLSLTAAPLAPEDLPWRIAAGSEQPVLGTAMGIGNQAGELLRLIVNATRIVDGNGVARGVIATFDDVTALHTTNEQLSQSIRQLRFSQAKISEQNEKLQLLVSIDSLTGCLNRRTFFERAERLLSDAAVARRPLSFVMVDVDYFKTVNDRFGHLIGDRVLSGLASLLQEICVAPHLVGRYGGEEFCLAIAGLSEAVVTQLVEQIRLAVADVRTWLPSGERTTVSMGIASLGDQPCTLIDLVTRADAALYAAKAGGRNRVVSWRDIAQDPQPQDSDQPVVLAR